jgi:hypothetical protein
MELTTARVNGEDDAGANVDMVEIRREEERKIGFIEGERSGWTQ